MAEKLGVVAVGMAAGADADAVDAGMAVVLVVVVVAAAVVGMVGTVAVEVQLHEDEKDNSGFVALASAAYARTTNSKVRQTKGTVVQLLPSDTDEEQLEGRSEGVQKRVQAQLVLHLEAALSVQALLHLVQH